MRVHHVAGRGALARRLTFLTALIVAIGALLAPSTSLAGSSHAKSHKTAHHKKHKKHKKGKKPGSSNSGGAKSSSLKSHGIKLAILNANQSSNWFGYNQGALESGKSLFTSITGDWTVPTATQHTSGQAESSSDWIGIGGGCMETSCTATDQTLIQTGTEQDVSSNGTASYSAWYELIPAPSISISMTVQPGDHMHASLSQTLPEVWQITLQDVTRNESFSTTLPYPSTEGSAEWIEETPLVLGANAGFAALPNLSTVPFTNATANGAPANLQPAEEMDLTDSSGTVIGAPSAPKSSTSFDDCAWASSCS
jgi:Peptidase A4 family